METSTCRRSRGGAEENVLAIIDATDSKDTQDADDDRIDFLQAVGAASFDQHDGSRPTNKMCEAAFRILRVGKSLELIMESFWLLNEIDKRFPRVYLSDAEAEASELVVVEEAWSPLDFNLDITFCERKTNGKCSCGPFDSVVFHLLIQNLGEVIRATDLQRLEIKSLGKMLLFQYLINVLEGDFIPPTMLIKSSRRINYKVLMKDCLSIMCDLCQVSAESDNDLGSSGNPHQNGHAATALDLAEVGNATCAAMQKLLTMIMELDVSRKIADEQGCTTRADGVRTPLVEIILDEITYDRHMLSRFLQIFKEPKWKLEVVLQYFSKYTAKPSVRTRRSNGLPENDGTFIGILKCFSNVTSTKNITKKISEDVIQMLLARAFQAYLLSLPSSQQEVECSFDSKDRIKSNSLVEICRNLISAFSSLRSADENMEILPLGKEALFTAAAILSTKT